MTHNKLKLNSEKTEAVLIETRQKLSSLSVNTLQLDYTTVVLINSTVSMENFISVTAKSRYYQLRRISSVRNYVFTEAIVELVTPFILSCLDYCSSLLSGLPASSVQSDRRIQNCAARLILKKRRTDYITPLFQFLRWLPIQQRIQYKINTLCHKSITGTAASYLSSHFTTPSCTFPERLRSASDTLSLQIPRTRLSTVGSCAFSVFGPSTWNDLPLPLRQKPSMDSFKSNLKTFLFPKL